MTETRPTLFKPEHVDQAHELGAQGLTDREIAAEFGVSRATIIRWRAKHPDFAAACARGKEIADDRVEGALYERAIGYEMQVVRAFMPEGASDPVYAAYPREVPANVQAAALWLRNRRPQQWSGHAEERGNGSFIDMVHKALARVADHRPSDPDAVDLHG